LRLVALGLALALAAAPAAAEPLAPGEVLLELGAIGTATVPADLATIRLTISGSGETEAAARADLETRYRRVAAAARQAGVPAAAITRAEPSQIEDLRTFDVTEEPPLPDGAPVEAGATPPTRPPGVPTHFSNSAVIVRVTDLALVPAIRRALDAAADTEFSNPTPVYSLIDSRAARQTARAQALAAVRADAEAYAASLGMRVARIVRVSERTGVGMLPLLLGESSLVRQAFGPRPGESGGRDVSVFVVVGVDFALAPR
jgi:uncharacterized protein YggE